MSSSQDVRFNEERVKQGADLANKLWNASRLVLLRVEDVDGGAAHRDGRGPLDRLAPRAADRAGHRAVRGLRDVARGARALRRLLDRRLRLVPRARRSRGSTATAPPSATLLWVLERTLTLLHPIMPFVTEEIWSYMPGDRGLLAASSWPRARPRPDRRRGRGDRRRRDRHGDRAAPVPRRGRRAGAARRSARGCQRSRRSRITSRGSRGSSSSTTATRRSRRVGPDRDPSLRGHLGGRPGRARRRAPCAALEAEIARAEGKLANEGFVKKAPPEVVEREREKLERFRAELAGRYDVPRGRGLPARPRAVRDAVRARPHAQADDGARHAAAAVRVDPRRRLERQVVDRPDDRGDPRAPRAADRLVHLAASARRSPSASRWGSGRFPNPPSPPRWRAPPTPPSSSTARSPTTTRSPSSRR